MKETIAKNIPKQIRLLVLARSQGFCEDCQSRKKLELHHLHYETVGHEAPYDLVALCRECHLQRHIDWNGDWWNDPQEMAWHWEAYFEESETG